MRLLVLLAALVFALDQATKWLVVVWLDLAHRLVLDVWPPFFRLTMAWNQGINFGLFAHESEWVRWGLVVLGLVLVGVIILWAYRERSEWVRLGAGLLIGGAAGNVVDRVRWGAVADFINISCCSWQNPWAFNIADTAIALGALVMLFAAGRQKRA